MNFVLFIDTRNVRLKVKHTSLRSLVLVLCQTSLELYRDLPDPFHTESLIFRAMLGTLNLSLNDQYSYIVL